MIDDAQLDMLVDGEPDATQRRTVPSQLVTDPDGWRRCALAFLEAQSWRQEMRTLSDESAEAAPVASKTPIAWHRFRTGLAMAASFLLALGLGLAMGDMFDEDQPLLPPSHAAKGQPEPVRPSIDPNPEVAPEAVPEAAPYQYVAIPTQDPVSGEPDSIRMPVVPRELLGEGWPYQLPSVLPDDVVQSLHQRGHDVVQQRRLIPFQADDGSRIVFPVDEVELVPVSNRGYQ